MLDLLNGVLKEVGISHVNALLLMIIAYGIWKGFASLVDQLKRQNEQINTMVSDIRVGQQWQVHHEQEDNRRADEIRELVKNRHKR